MSKMNVIKNNENIKQRNTMKYQKLIIFIQCIIHNSYAIINYY